jgi:hypothetical protein
LEAKQGCSIFIHHPLQHNSQEVWNHAAHIATPFSHFCSSRCWSAGFKKKLARSGTGAGAQCRSQALVQAACYAMG